MSVVPSVVASVTASFTTSVVASVVVPSVAFLQEQKHFDDLLTYLLRHASPRGDFAPKNTTWRGFQKLTFCVYFLMKQVSTHEIS